jgi:hypothetical protein
VEVDCGNGRPGTGWQYLTAYTTLSYRMGMCMEELPKKRGTHADAALADPDWPRGTNAALSPSGHVWVNFCVGSGGGVTGGGLVVGGRRSLPAKTPERL